ncbi:DUF1361 domain-containing protein [Leptospira langatensis]|uniref:DUF1361 domain-containing protein n=1 Tax=Leptospira langatensis TaxID=2484983 RepID=A0A5F1ZXH8_9LEPT|nr:DUF1361 domain-containing protein [Leptospira langatensis]TGJ98583.1 DUF1361 domain-containing protein [Leptospira langatensis]TGL43496.1 DUF1361 domain-containing protein [Leptospira langatensis]
MKASFKIPFFSQLFTLAISCVLSLVLIHIRILISQKVSYYFLIWNLILAMIPVGVAYFAYIYYEWRNRRIDPLFFLLLTIWLLFFPNAPYIVTDFVHLKPRHSIPIWFDIFLIFSFSWNGFFSGLISLRMMHLILNDKMNVFTGWIFILLVAPVAAFGIYIGRFYRWNSWDIIENPGPLFYDSLKLIQSVLGNKELASILGLTSLGIFLAYALILSVGGMQMQTRSGKGRG